MQEQSRLGVRRFLERARRQLRSQDELAELVSRLGYPIKRSAVGHWMTGHEFVAASGHAAASHPTAVAVGKSREEATARLWKAVVDEIAQREGVTSY